MIEINSSPIVLKQKRELTEILIGLEGRNTYELKNQSGEVLLFIQEEGSGIWLWFKRQLFRSHRPLAVAIYHPQTKNKIAMIQRPFYFFWSDIYLHDQAGKLLAQVHRRFAWFKGKYDICDHHNSLVGRVEIPFWRIWSFTLFDKVGREVGKIAKEWGGLFKEWLTDADTLALHFNSPVSKELMWGGFLTLVTVDFDYFEDNSGARSVIDLVTPNRD